MTSVKLYSKKLAVTPQLADLLNQVRQDSKPQVPRIKTSSPRVLAQQVANRQ